MLLYSLFVFLPAEKETFFSPKMTSLFISFSTFLCAAGAIQPFEWSNLKCSVSQGTCSMAYHPLIWNPSEGQPSAELKTKFIMQSVTTFPSSGPRQIGTIFALVDPAIANTNVLGQIYRPLWLDNITGQGYKVIIPHMRGMGLSSPRIFCDDNKYGFDELPSYECVRSKYTDPSLSYYDLTSAALDLNATISHFTRLPKPGTKHPEPVFLLAEGFYGFWAQRYLALFAAQTPIKRVLLVSTPAGNNFDLFNAISSGSEAAIRRILNFCGRNAECSAAVGKGIDPETMFEQTMRLAKFDLLPCNKKLLGKAPLFQYDENEKTNDGYPGNGFVKAYSQLFSQLSSPQEPFASGNFSSKSGNWFLERGRFVPALLLRLHRCSATDVEQILFLHSFLEKYPVPDYATATNYLHAYRGNLDIKNPAGYESSLVKYNIAFNELLTTYPLQTLAFNRAVNSLNVDMTLYVRHLLSVWSIWHPYFNKPLATEYPQPAIGRWYPSQMSLSNSTLVNITFITGEFDDMAPPAAQSLATQYYPKHMTSMSTMAGVGRRITADAWGSMCLALVAAKYFTVLDNESHIPGCVFAPSPIFSQIEGASLTHLQNFSSGGTHVFNSPSDDPVAVQFTDQQVSYAIPHVVVPETIKGNGSSKSDHLALIIAGLTVLCFLLTVLAVFACWKIRQRYHSSSNGSDGQIDTRGAWESSVNASSGSAGPGFFTSDNNRGSGSSGVWGSQSTAPSSRLF